MPDRHHQRLTAWTAAGIAAVCITLILTGLGMVWAIRQTQSLARLRIADLEDDARLIKENALKQGVSQLKTTLQAIAGNLRHNGGRNPTAGIVVPTWIQEIYVFDERPSVRLWRRNDGEWRRYVHANRRSNAPDAVEAAAMSRLLPPLLTARFDPRPEPVQFVYDVANGKPVVIAHRAILQGLSTLTIVGVRLDLGQFCTDILEPRLPLDRLTATVVPPDEASAFRRKHEWTVEMAPLAPFVHLTPTTSFVGQQRQAVIRQTVVFLIGMALATGALLAVIWAMWRVFRREIALSQMKQAFVADVSHELKTPLALIRLFGETLLSGRVPTEEKKREYYEIITRESDRLTHLINNILDFARIDAGKKRYAMQPTDIAQLVRETYEAYQLQLDHDGFEHQLVIGEDLPRVSCDRDAVAQAIINLINNAMKYTDPEDKFLGIDVSRETRRGQHGVLISVSDRGIGIKPEDRSLLFTDFYRASDDRVRNCRGAGLGLALVKHIADGHGGIVDVESRLVKGSTFRIFFPENPLATIAEDEDDAQNSDR